MKKFFSPALKLIGQLVAVLFILVIVSAKASHPETDFFGFVSDPTPVSWEISGEIKENDDGCAVPFANIAVMDAQGSEIIGGGTSCLEGNFSIEIKDSGEYILRISAVGFETLFVELHVMNLRLINLGSISLQARRISLGEVLVVAERIKAATGAEKTSYFVNRNMLSASNTGTDLLKLVPGVSVDIRQNILLEGNHQVLVLVDGVERDREFVAQIPAARIDKIEVSNHPSSRFDGSASGVINIILVREKNAGFEGQVYLEVPSKSDEVYLFPKYSLRYGSGKLNFFTSYTGELTSLKVMDSYQRTLQENKSKTRINGMNLLQQRTWSHRFHYGMDYFINERNQINFYGYYNPFSFEYSGASALFINGSENSSWSVDKNDHDSNHSFYNAVFYKHNFSETGVHELTADLGFYNLSGENSSILSNTETGYYHMSQTLPKHQALTLKTDYRRPLPANFNYEGGAFARKEIMADGAIDEFDYGESTLAVYNTLGFNGKKFNAIAGIRLERSQPGQNDGPKHSFTALLPSGSILYRIKNGQGLRLSYRQSIRYPRFYQLNPFQTVIDPYTVHAGNPFLKPVRIEYIQMEHSIRFGNQFVSTHAFYSNSKEVISQLNWLNNGEKLESGNFNLGNISQYGLQLTGAFSLGKRMGFNTVVRVFEVQSTPNSLGLESELTSCTKMGWHAGFSAYAKLPGEITASLVFNYSSPLPDLQVTRFSDALYFLSLEKDLGEGFRAGLISAIPFTGRFVYKGTEISGTGFSDYSTGEILMSKVPFWFKFTYQFSSGQKRQSVERRSEETESIQRRGF